jgi:hypothetical protein
MSRIVFPRPLQALLEHSPLLAPLRAFADRAGEIFADNKLPFFPDYTDHGIEHITRVLASQVDLIPDAIWTRSTPESSPRLLRDADAAVIIGATILHDIAMHLRPDGFLELISANTRFQPLPWFRDRHDERSEDRPWPDLWNEYILEARRLSDRQLANIIGEDSVQDGWKFQGLPERTGQWQRNDCLVIGEFTRRHHARLAHEIAIYGFPGLPVGMGDGEFPALGDARGPYPLTQLADLIGLVARSHGTTLRVCKAYLDAHPLYADTPRPEDAAVLYPMALLRVADFLQIDRQRAPAVLLGLRNPQSPISVREWAKHRAVRNIAWGSDPCAVMVTVDTNISLSLFLQIQELLESLQQEIDHSTAALDETYGPLTHLGLEQLGLTLRRVRSNITRRTFLDRLPYVPERVGFSADPNVLALLVEPLYGREPGVGVRELMQNAVDAVRELHAWCVLKERSIDSIDRADHEGDVLVEFVQEQKDGPWVLRVRDKGIGMTADTIQRYLLRAGASFRRSPEWANEFLGNDGHPNVIRAGRFGVGAFATFLLGHRFRLWTRHVTATAAQGCAIEATADADLIEIRREKIDPVGTTVEVELSAEAAAILKLGGSERDAERILNERTDWFCWDCRKERRSA